MHLYIRNSLKGSSKNYHLSFLLPREKVRMRARKVNFTTALKNNILKISISSKRYFYTFQYFLQ